MRLIGYTYEAEYHCKACTFKQYPVLTAPTTDDPVDREGNPLYAVYDTDEVPEGGWTCGDCLTKEGE